MEEYTQQLERLTEDLLSLSHPGPLRAAALDLHALFSRIVGLRDDSSDPADTQPTNLPAGVAIDPLSAARCTLDFARTTKFLRGIYAAVRVAQQRFFAQPIEILYAGCGPFATLAIPLMTQFSADEVRFTLLDIHQRSLDSARLLVETLGFAAHVRDYLQADAATYVQPAERTLHIVITETMLEALRKEPQVAVTLNLAPQLCAGGILIPERITVDACLYNPATEFQLTPAGSVDESPSKSERMRIMLGRLIELDIASVPRLCSEGFPAVRIKLPAADEQRLRLMLRTEVTVFESFILGDYAASITIPHQDKEFDALAPGSGVMFQYEVGSMPGFRLLRGMPQVSVIPSGLHTSSV